MVHSSCSFLFAVAKMSYCKRNFAKYSSPLIAFHGEYVRLAMRQARMWQARNVSGGTFECVMSSNMSACQAHHEPILAATASVALLFTFLIGKRMKFVILLYAANGELARTKKNWEEFASGTYSRGLLPAIGKRLEMTAGRCTEIHWQPRQSNSCRMILRRSLEIWLVRTNRSVRWPRELRESFESV